MSKEENCSENREKNMNGLAKKCLSGVAAFVLLSGMFFGIPATLQAKTKADTTVDVTVTVHGSGINVSTKVMEESIEKLLEAAEVKFVKQGAGAGIIEFKIDIFKSKDGGFRVDCDWDEDDETEAQENAKTQEEIDDIVEDMVDSFIEFLSEG